MPDHITGIQKKLKQIFEESNEFIIPLYQRPYSWEEEQIEALFDDLYEFYLNNQDDDYFLGSIVLINGDRDDSYEVIDGQQRLTSLTILFSAIADFMNDPENKKDIKKYIQQEARRSQKIEEKPRIILRKSDQEFFKKYIIESDLNQLFNLDFEKLKTESQRLIYQNTDKIRNKLNEFFDNEDDLMDFVSFIVSNCYLISVESPNRDSAFRVFSVLNNRGLELTASDLIKSEIIGILEKKDPKLSEEYAQKWEDLEVLIGRDEFVELLSHTRMIFQKQKAQSSLYDEFKKILETISPEDLIDSYLIPYSDIYYKIKNDSFSRKTKNIDKVINILDWLKKIPNDDWMPVAIKFLSTIKLSNENSYLFLKKLERMASFLHLTGKNWNQRPSRYAKILNSLDDENEFNQIKKGVMPESIELDEKDKSEFLDVIQGDVFLLAHQKKRYLLLRLDSFVSDGLAQYDTRLTIEHVLPQTPTNSYWLENWPDSDERKNWTHKIANLIPLSRTKNSAAKNWDFPTKKKKYFPNKKEVSSYNLATQILQTKDWTPEIVRNRQEELINVIKDNWELK